jgi:magnesium chelatase family protein
MAKLSGALADRIDITFTVDPPSPEELRESSSEDSSAVRKRVLAARAAQEERLGPGRANADMTPGELRRHCHLDPLARRTLDDGHRQLGLSARGWDRCLRLARTIADLAGEERINVEHVSEAIDKRRRTER